MHQKNFVSQTLVQNTVINLQVLLSPIISSKDFLQFLRRPFTPWTLTPIMSKEPTRAQLSSRLAYHGKMPAFLQKLQKQVNGSGGGGESDEEDDEWEVGGRCRTVSCRLSSGLDGLESAVVWVGVHGSSRTSR